MTAAELKAARRTLGWTMEQMSESLGIHQGLLRRWANGTYRVHSCAALIIAHWIEHPECRPNLPHTKYTLRNC